MTFKERFLRNDCNMDAIDDWTEHWHSGAANGLSLQEFLGLTDEEYAAWLSEGPDGLSKAIQKDSQVQYKAVYLTWDELSSQLQTLVLQLLGPRYFISVRRLDFYYWEMKIEPLYGMDESLSAKFCERLELHGVDRDYFMDHDAVDDDQLLCLLEKLTGYEVSSSHADDNGVWIICKEYRTSSREYADRLISGCEKRLRAEIRSDHYRLVNPDTACHQLYGFMEALKALGIIPEEACRVSPEHFSGTRLSVARH